MKVVVSWLRDLCPTELPAVELAELLGSRGAEVESIATARWIRSSARAGSFSSR